MHTRSSDNSDSPNLLSGPGIYIKLGELPGCRIEKGPPEAGSAIKILYDPHMPIR